MRGGAPRPPGLTVDGSEIPLVTIGYGAPIGLPDEEEGTLLVVSKIVADAAPGRSDLVMPDLVVRDDAGRIVACRGLARPRRP